MRCTPCKRKSKFRSFGCLKWRLLNAVTWLLLFCTPYIAGYETAVWLKLFEEAEKSFAINCLPDDSECQVCTMRPDLVTQWCFTTSPCGGFWSKVPTVTNPVPEIRPRRNNLYLRWNSPTDWFSKIPHIEKIDDVIVQGSVLFESFIASPLRSIQRFCAFTQVLL